MDKKIKKKWGDRYDGRRVRKGDPTNIIIPFNLFTIGFVSIFDFIGLTVLVIIKVIGV